MRRITTAIALLLLTASPLPGQLTAVGPTRPVAPTMPILVIAGPFDG